MKRLSAAEAPDWFAEMLDEVERTGEPISVLRSGRTVAEIGPENKANGAAVIELLRNAPHDPEWAERMEDIHRFVNWGPSADTSDP